MSETASRDIVERFRGRGCWCIRADGKPSCIHCIDRRDAADEIERLLKQVATYNLGDEAQVIRRQSDEIERLRAELEGAKNRTILSMCAHGYLGPCEDCDEGSRFTEQTRSDS